MSLSIVIPAYNEEGSLQELHAKLVESLTEIGQEYEIIFVDDGSSDGTFSALEKLHTTDPNVKVIRFRRNFGKAAALTAGFRAAQGEIIVTMDADLQDDPVEIPRFLEKLDEGYDLVTGWKYPRLDPLSKTLPSRLANGTVRMAAGLDIHDMNCGFKAMRRTVTEEITLYGELHRYIPVLANWRGFRLAEIKVKHHPRPYGKSKYGLERLARGLFDFMTVFFLSRFNRRPLHFFGMFGLLAFLAGFAIDAYLAYIRLVLGIFIGHRPLLTLGTLLITIGVQFFSFGLLAEMFTYGAMSKERDYSIRETLE
ncbi:MAG: glycosyltransferase [Anaerolineales bacterium]|nr:glycosyltransferase [Anaerolineales bacterium]